MLSGWTPEMLRCTERQQANSQTGLSVGRDAVFQALTANTCIKTYAYRIRCLSKSEELVRNHELHWQSNPQSSTHYL